MPVGTPAVSAERRESVMANGPVSAQLRKGQGGGSVATESPSPAVESGLGSYCDNVAGYCIGSRGLCS